MGVLREDVVMSSSATEVMTRFVRGETDVASLQGLGIEIELNDGVRLVIPSDCPTIEPSAPDLAVGLLSQWAIGGEALQRWAQVLLGLTSIDLVALEAHAEGDQILEALWDASAGHAISESALTLARRLVN